MSYYIFGLTKCEKSSNKRVCKVTGDRMYPSQGLCSNYFRLTLVWVGLFFTPKMW